MRRAFFPGAVALQSPGVVIFVPDTLDDLKLPNGQTVLAIGGVPGLSVGISLTLRDCRNMLICNSRIEMELGAAADTFSDPMLAHFDDWRLTAAGRDVALMSVKGLSIVGVPLPCSN